MTTSKQKRLLSSLQRSTKQSTGTPPLSLVSCRATGVGKWLLVTLPSPPSPPPPHGKGEHIEELFSRITIVAFEGIVARELEAMQTSEPKVHVAASSTLISEWAVCL